MTRNRMTATFAAAVLFHSPQPSAAFDDSGHFGRMLHCISPDGDVSMELFLPNAAELGGGQKKPVIGYYALDLEKIGKGKPLEPVKVWKDDEAKVLIVDQYTRGLPPTRVPLDGGVVNFDNRFGDGARCKPYGDTREDEYGSAFPPAPAASPPEESAAEPQTK